MGLLSLPRQSGATGSKGGFFVILTQAALLPKVPGWAMLWLCPPCTLLGHCWAPQLPRGLASLSGQEATRNYSATGWAMTQLSCRGRVRLGSKASKVLCVRNWIRETGPPVGSLLRLCCRLVSAESKQSWSELPLGLCRRALPRCLCWLFQAPHS